MRLWLALLLIPGVQACGFTLDDALDDQESPFPAAGYDIQALNASTGEENLSLGLLTVPGSTNTIQYIFNFGHASYIYIVSCRDYTINPTDEPATCDLSRSPAGAEGGAAVFEHVGGIEDFTLEQGNVTVRIPYAMFGGEEGDITDFYYGATQAAVSDALPEPYPQEGTFSPVVVDTVRDLERQLVLCGPVERRPESAPAPAVDKDVPLPLGWSLLGLFLARRALL